MTGKEKDKRLLIPRDGFEEEASEGLGRLSREEAEEDLRELRRRMDRRLRRPLAVWVPAAAAVVLLLIASAIYVSLFRQRDVTLAELAVEEDGIRDTILIAMAEPIIRVEPTPGAPVAVSYQRVVSTESNGNGVVMAAAEPERVSAEIFWETVETSGTALAEEVVVDAMPRLEKTAMRDSRKRAEDSAVLAGKAAEDTYRPAAPATGRDRYVEWIRKNATYPPGVAEAAPQTVVVTFSVSGDSTLTNFSAVQSPGELFTNEVIRLLRQGPKWTPAMSNGRIVEETVRLTVEFR